MTLQVQVTGAAAFQRVAAQIRAEGRKDLSRQMGEALTRATEPLQEAIAASAEETMPSGYKEALTQSLAWRRSQRTAGQRAQIILRTYADGQVKRRDVVALERGNLRHPFWGRRSIWHVTNIRPGFHQRGTERAADAVVAQLDKVVADFAQRLIS